MIRYRNRDFKLILKCLALALVFVMLFTSLSFAEDTANSMTNKTEQTTENNESSNTITDSTNSLPDTASVPGSNSGEPETTASKIARYSTYKGKNAARIPVITYHQILTDKQKRSKKNKRDPWSVSQSTFNRQMSWLHKKHYRTINCDEFYLWRIGKIKLPKRTVLITFDDGNKLAIEKSLPVLKKYKMKATYFIIGKPVHEGGTSRFISEQRVRQIMKTYPNVEFQSHTYNLHYKGATKLNYNSILKDAKTQKDVFDFRYLAYPYGRKTNTMIKVYKDSGIKMAFSFSDYGFATRKQNLYKIKRFAVKGNTSFRKFKRWCS